MKFLCAEKISEHKYKTPEGYLVCVDSVLARTGKQTYKRSELFGCDCKDADSEVDVDRPAEEVFSDKTLASFENKPLTIEHPDEDVNTSNHKDLAVGFARDIKRGKDNGQDVMLGTLVFTDDEAIEAIENGEMVELSCGYDADIADEDNPCQRNIRGNHIALCQRGRAGNARIVDSMKVKDTLLQKGKVYVTRAGATLKVIDFDCTISDYNGAPGIVIKYEYVSASGKNRGSSTATAHDFWKMLTDKSLTGDSIDDTKWFDPEYDKYVTEDYIKKQYEKMKQSSSYFKQTYEKFRADNFIEVKPGMERYYDSINDDVTLTRRKLEEFVSRHPGKVHNNSFVKMTSNKYSCIVTEENMAFVKNELNRMGFNNVRQSGGKHVVFEDSGLHQEQLAQREYDEAKKRLHYLYEQRRKANLSGGGGMKFESEISELEKKIERLQHSFDYALGDTMKDADFSKQSKQGYQVVEMYRDAGRLHAILKRSNDYVIAYGYDTSDGTWAQGRYDFTTLDRARQALQEEKKYARRITDVDTYEEATNGLKEQAKNVNDAEVNVSSEHASHNGRFYGYMHIDHKKYGSFYVSYMIKGRKNIIQTDGSPWNFIMSKGYTSEQKRWIEQHAGELERIMNRGNVSDSKEDILRKIRTTQIREGDTFEMRDGQYLVQIQNVGKQTIEFKGNNWKVGKASVKESSWAWGRIWKNGTIVFNETDALNVVRDKMIQFLKTVRDSKGDK